MRHNWSRSLYGLNSRRHGGQHHILTLTTRRFLTHEQEVQWEADVERVRVFDLLDVFAGQLERQSSNVAVKV